MDLDSLISQVQGNSEQPSPLTGDDLIAAVKSSTGSTREELLNACGYYSDKSGKRQYKFTEFYQALIQAQGLEIPSSSRGGRSLPWEVTCQKAGHVLLGAAYLRDKGFKTGDKFKVQINEGSIKLTPISTK